MSRFGLAFFKGNHLRLNDVSVTGNQGLNAPCYRRPGQLDGRAVRLLQAQPLAVVVFTAARCAGQRMAATADAILVFEKACLLSQAVVAFKVALDTAFAARHAAAH